MAGSFGGLITIGAMLGTSGTALLEQRVGAVDAAGRKVVSQAGPASHVFMLTKQIVCIGQKPQGGVVKRGEGVSHVH